MIKLTAKNNNGNKEIIIEESYSKKNNTLKIFFSKPENDWNKQKVNQFLIAVVSSGTNTLEIDPNSTKVEEANQMEIYQFEYIRDMFEIFVNKYNELSQKDNQ